VASSKQQALIEAPVKSVWDLLVDPARGPDWDPDVLEVTGAPVKIETGSTFDVTGRGPLGMKATTTFKVEELDDMHEIKMQCQKSGFYVHWLLTPAQGNTFAEVELGIEALPGLQARAMGALHTRGYLRRTAEQTLEALRGALARRRARLETGAEQPRN
jgi:uncharacterized protein YndB with AHSA1/START domain